MLRRDHFPSTCDGCAAALNAATANGHTSRQVFDLPEPQPLVVTEHRAHLCRCPACGRQTRAAFPDGVGAPVQSAHGSRPSCCICCIISCCPRSVWRRGWPICSACGW